MDISEWKGFFVIWVNWFFKAFISCWIPKVLYQFVTDSGIMLIHSHGNLSFYLPSPIIIPTTFNFLWCLGSAYGEFPPEGNLDTPTAVVNVLTPLATPLIESDCRWSKVWSDCSSENCSLWACSDSTELTSEQQCQTEVSPQGLHQTYRFNIPDRFDMHQQLTFLCGFLGG